MSRLEDERGGPPVERPAGESSYGACGAPSCTMAWTATVRALEVEVERLRAERQAVLDCVNLYGDTVLHDALDAIGWPEPRGAKTDA